MKKYGKATGKLFTTILSNLGAETSYLLVPPGVGFDNGILSIDERRVIIYTSDPISFIPSLGPERSAWLSLHHLASDFTTSGIMPKYAIMNYNLPPSLDDKEVARYVRELSKECKKLGIAIVGGHTGRYPGCDLTIIGSGALFGFADKDEYLTPRMARPDDVIVLTKGAAIESTAVLASSFAGYVKKKLGVKLWGKAVEYIAQCSTVMDAVVASKNHMTAMHDATEGGVIGALHELSIACGRRLSVDLGKLHVSQETSAICSLFGIDPLRSLSGGSLLVTCSEENADSLQYELRRKGIESFRIGRVLEENASGSVIDKQGRSIAKEREDPYWLAYYNASISSYEVQSA